MQLELREKEDAELRQKEVQTYNYRILSLVSISQVTFHIPANTVVSPHKDTMCRIRSLYDGTLVTCSQVYYMILIPFRILFEHVICVFILPVRFYTVIKYNNNNTLFLGWDNLLLD